MPEIDLSQLPPPEVVERLDYETILAELVADFLSRNEEYDAFVESDPALKLLETAAYREYLLRWRINEAAKAVMVAHAEDANLEHLVALFGIRRAGGESDERLLRRQQLSLDRLSVAGPRGAYEFHALGADPTVKRVTLKTPTPGTVEVIVLGGETEDALPSAVLLKKVESALDPNTVRPQTDTVKVLGGRNIIYQVAVTIYVEAGPDREVVREAAEKRVLAYVRAAHRVGGVVHKSAITGAAQAPGVTHSSVAFSWKAGVAYDAEKLDLTDAAFNAAPAAWKNVAAFWPAKEASVNPSTEVVTGNILGYQHPATAPLDGVTVVVG